MRSRSSRRTNHSSPRDGGRFPHFTLAPRPERDAVLVVARDPVRSTLADYCRSAGFEVFAAATPLDAIQALEIRGHRIAYAVITSESSWGFELRNLIANDHAGIKRVMLLV